VTDVAAGERHACAIVKGVVQCWGANFSGQAVPGSRQTEQPTPWTVVEAGAASIAAGDEQSCAIVAGALWCWGRTGLDLKSADTFGISSAPVEVIAQGVGAIAAGTHHACAIVDSALWCWGNNERGQLGVATGYTHTCALADGALRCSEKGAFDNGISPFGISGLEARLGVWRGSIGKQRIMLCLQRHPYASTYYYLRHKFGIALSDTSGNGSVWSEEAADRPGASWELQLPERDRLEGEWSDADGKTSFPIRLTRVSSAGDGDPGCAIEGADRTAFNAPRVAAEKLTIEESSGQRRISVLNGRPSTSTRNAASRFGRARGWSSRKVTMCTAAAPIHPPALPSTKPGT
jgi:hypothetical protein